MTSSLFNDPDDQFLADETVSMPADTPMSDQPTMAMLPPPTLGADEPTTDSKADREKPERRRKAWLAAVLALACLGGASAAAWWWLQGEVVSPLLLSQGDRSDLFLVEPGADVTRNDRVLDEIVDVDSIRSWDGRVVRESTRVVDGWHMVSVSSFDGARLVGVRDGVSQELLETDGWLDVVAAGDRLFVREQGDGADRCFRGSPGSLERVFRGDRCVFTSTGHLLTVSERRNGFVVEVENPSGNVVLEGDFDALPELSDTGRFLILRSDDLFEVFDVESGEIALERQSVTGHRVSTGPDGALLAVVSDEDGGIHLSHVSNRGSASTIAATGIEDGVLEVGARFAHNGDVVWTESIGGSESRVNVWPQGADEPVSVLEGESVFVVDTIDGSPIVARSDEFGVSLERAGADGVTELWSYDDGTLNGWLVVDGAALLVVGGEDAGAVVVELSTGRTVESFGWDDARIGASEGATAVAIMSDGGDDIPVSLRVGASPTELGEFESVGRIALIDGVAYITELFDGDTDTFAVDANTGEENLDVDYLGYRVVGARAPSPRESISVQADVSGARAYCEALDLDIVRVGETVTVLPGSGTEEFCVNHRGFVRVRARANDNDPTLEIDDLGSLYAFNDDDGSTLSSELFADLDGYAIVRVGDLQGGSRPIDVTVSRG